MEIKQSKLGGTADLSDIFSSTHNSSTGSVEGSTMYMVGIRGQFVGWGSGVINLGGLTWLFPPGISRGSLI